jgi:7,8-dihydro-6-hydroxymethylpterin-pyrophosphokinase
VGATARPPAAILRLAKQLEADAGRDPAAPRWGPRPLDVDLLLYGDVVCHDPRLTLPHPRLHERAFVLVPLAEIAPQMRVPPEGRTVAELLAELERDGGAAGVERVGRRLSPGPPPAPAR